MNEIIEKLQDKNDNKAHKLLLELEVKSAESSKLYSCFEAFAELTMHNSSFVRARGFRLCCAQAKWDTENKLEKNINMLLLMLDDDKPTAVRQCLAALQNALIYKPNLCTVINDKLESLVLTKYKDSMQPLLERDIEELKQFQIKNGFQAERNILENQNDIKE